MKSLPERIMGYAEAKPEATPIHARPPVGGHWHQFRRGMDST